MRMNNKKVGLLLILLKFALFKLSAQEGIKDSTFFPEIVVTGTRMPISRDILSTPKSIIKREKIEKYITVKDHNAKNK